MQVYKFNTMFRGQAVVIEYGYADVAETKVQYAFLSKDNINHLIPFDNDYCHRFLIDFEEEIYQLTVCHVSKVKQAFKQ